jgi:hypothetical protein
MDANEIYKQAVILIEAYGVDTYDEDFPVTSHDLPGILEFIAFKGLE